MDPARFQMHVCSLADYVPLADSLRDRDTRFHKVLRKSRFDWTVISRLKRLIHEIKAEVVHGYLFDAEISSRLAGRMAGIPVIGSERNTDYKVKRSDYIAYRLTGRARDLTIANSSAGADFNSRTFKTRRDKFRVVHNGVDADRFQPRSGAELRRELGVRDDDLVVGMFGSFKPQKNQPLLLKAAKQVLEKFPNTKFMFVGDELHAGGSGSVEFKQTIERIVADFNLRPSCLFVGNQKQVERYYNACDLTALPSLFEGTPNVALESMASGLPVVATKVSDNCYVIPDGKVGFIVPSGDENALADRICRVLSDAALRERLGAAARQWVMQEFTGERLAAKTADVYEEALRMKGKL
jgi:glycosyltransferase involved in cell wall biosynthesis